MNDMPFEPCPQGYEPCALPTQLASSIFTLKFVFDKSCGTRQKGQREPKSERLIYSATLSLSSLWFTQLFLALGTVAMNLPPGQSSCTTCCKNCLAASKLKQ